MPAFSKNWKRRASFNACGNEDRRENSVLIGDGVFAPMRLVMFDIDGTLTDTMKVDALCFVRAFAEVCGFGRHRYRLVTLQTRHRCQHLLRDI